MNVKPWDSDHTALVHVLWEAAEHGLTTISDPDALAAHIMHSHWMEAVRLHAAAPSDGQHPASAAASAPTRPSDPAGGETARFTTEERRDA